MQDSDFYKYASLPKLQTLELSCDELYEAGKTVRAFVGVSEQWDSLECTGLGTFRLQMSPGCKVKVMIRHEHLTASLPDALESCEADLYDLEGSGPRSEHGTYTLACEWTAAKAHDSFTHLAWWLNCYDLLQHGGDPYNEMPYFLSDRCKGTTEVPIMNKSLHDPLRLQDLTVSEHGPELVEWASELLMMNLSAMIEGRAYGGGMRVSHQADPAWLAEISDDYEPYRWLGRGGR